MTLPARAARDDDLDDEPLNVAAYLPLMARRQPEALAVAVATGRGTYQRLSCAELDRRADRIAHGLVGNGITCGVRTVLMVKPSAEFFALTFALFKVGAVPVFVDPGMGVANLGTCLGEAEPEAFIGIPKAHVGRWLLGWARPTLKTRITVGGPAFFGDTTLAKLEAGAPAEPFALVKVEEQQTAAILFTSGSTGCPKGAVYTHGVFSSQVRLLKKTYGIEPGEVDLSTFPLFALFGPALGMASVVPKMDATRPATADPRLLLRAIADFSCTNMFASPALIDKLGRFCARRGVSLPTLRRAISAGAPASMSSIERFAGLLTGEAQVFTPYGATEALPVASIGSASLLGETRGATDSGAGVCVGRPCPEMQVAIIGISDDRIERWNDAAKLPPGRVGEIVVRGPVVTERYYNRGDSTALAKIVDPRDGAVWHRMGDLGKLDDQGRLWMCGRKSQRVQTADGTLFTVPCEAVFNTHPRVRRTALVGVSRPDADLPVLCVELEAGASRRVRRRIRRELEARAAQHDHTRSIRAFLFHPGFPVDVRHNAKISREALALWAEKRLS